MKPVVRIVLLVALAGGLALGGTAAWRHYHPKPSDDELRLFGNVDLRQVELPFNVSERIAEVTALEGDRVRAGQVLARADTSRLAPQVAQAEAITAAQRAVVERLRNGSRPEEIAQGRANVDAAKADARNARVQYDRVKNLATSTDGRAISQQEVDAAKATLDVADAKVVTSQKALDLLVAGPRAEEVAQAEAQLRGDEANLAYVRQQLKDAELVAPRDAVVRARLMEPGEMASPQKPVYTLAITDPKWVRAYVAETELGRVVPGMAVEVSSDSFPSRRFGGWIGFVSSVAEFTPKPVQTEELRTKLVYEVRAFVRDPGDELRLGMPATVYVRWGATPATRPASTQNAVAVE